MVFRKVVIACLFLGLTLGVSPALASPEDGQGDDHGTTAALPNCPVMGEPIDFSVSVAADDGPVFFCCQSCVKKYKENLDKFATGVAAQRKALADRPKIQVTCPVSGKAVDQKVSVEHDGQKVYFCCKDCVSKYEAEPAKYASALANSYTYQTTCPVMGKPIVPTASIKLSTGQTIYFCCKGCDKKLLADPAKYNKNLVAQGIQINWADVK